MGLWRMGFEVGVGLYFGQMSPSADSKRDVWGSVAERRQRKDRGASSLQRIDYDAVVGVDLPGKAAQNRHPQTIRVGSKFGLLTAIFAREKCALARVLKTTSERTTSGRDEGRRADDGGDATASELLVTACVISLTNVSDKRQRV